MKNRVPFGLRTTATAMALGLAMAAPAAAQDGAGQSGVANASAADTTHVEQISTGAMGAAATAVAPGSSSDADRSNRTVADQLPGATTPQSGVAQLAHPGESAETSPQLASGVRSAHPPSPPLSTPAEGKPEGTVRLGGTDRCDPATGKDHDGRICANRIETRSADYSSPQAPTLSPEQKLLVAERMRAGGAGTDATIRRIGRNDIDTNSAVDQGLASLVLPSQPTEHSPDKKDETPTALDPAVAAVVQALTQAPPQ